MCLPPSWIVTTIFELPFSKTKKNRKELSHRRTHESRAAKGNVLVLFLLELLIIFGQEK